MYGVVDCNTFYASCERIFRPELEKIPVVVLSNNDGCIISQTKEVTELGSQTGSAVYNYKDLFKKHNVQIFSANFPLYADISSRIMKIIKNYVPHVEIYSIDEAFFKLSGYDKSYILHQSQLLRNAILKNIGMPVSIGISDTKTLSKIANEIAKTNQNYEGVCLINSKNIRDKLLQQFKIEYVWGIGRKLSQFLNKRGIFTAYQLMNCDDKWIKKELSITGLKTVWELRGISCIDVETERPAKKSIISSKSFGYKVTNIQDMKEAVATFATRAAEKLREEKEIATFITVSITTNYFRKDEKQYANSITLSLPQPTHYTPLLIKTGIQALEQIYKPGYRYKKATVGLTGLVSEHIMQGQLFHPVTVSQKEKRIMSVLDTINQQYGSGTLQYAIQGIHKRWKGKSESRSPRYTTNWDELLIVKS
ncbi:MAG TPA: Y-family DNA polymerase [Candidatus Woesebacteria bacterium]|nr:Y-family DNA polymerase [Candidatus Woesebacteria bacterium]